MDDADRSELRFVRQCIIVCLPLHTVSCHIHSYYLRASQQARSDIDKRTEKTTILIDSRRARSGDISVLLARASIRRKRTLIQLLQSCQHVFCEGGHNLGLVDLGATNHAHACMHALYTRDARDRLLICTPYTMATGYIRVAAVRAMAKSSLEQSCMQPPAAECSPP